jgi:hypothetical protein
MIQIYSKSIWDNTEYVDELHNLDGFSGCCGSRYYTNTKSNYNPKGIALREGKHFTEGQHKTNFVKHVETPDGVITLTLRTVW